MTDTVSQLPPRFEPVAISSESTVVAEFSPEPSRRTEYQSEAQLEAGLIEQLVEQGYEFLAITSSLELEANVRAQLEALNNFQFSDTEWERFFTQVIGNEAAGITDKARIINEDHVQLLTRDDGTKKNIYLIDKQHIHNNRLQVINQYEVEGARANRYDVTILVNGLPLVHIELKRRGVDIREAFNQINRYQRESFWADSGLFEYVQLFIISNGTHTKYYSNTTRSKHVSAAGNTVGGKRSSNSFEFTSWWADASNRPITDLVGFTKTFFAKHTLLNVLTKYCVFTVDQDLLVMRPYQIVATERILQRVLTSGAAKTIGTIQGGGYIWHTTGSGKTLTSFKTAQLASRMPGIDKVLFVVDRKDLDYQTQREYNRFEEGSVNANTSTRVLQRQIEDPNRRIIVTTIQKLSNFVAANKRHDAYGQRFVIIFDECHRSQFGDMHRDIVRSFKRYNLFGFTGTPIFADNSPSGGNPQFCTTEQAFGEKLHTYTIVDAINDKNVLPFRIDYISTVSIRDGVKDKQVSAIDTERALLAPERISLITAYILEHFDQKTMRNESYTVKDKRHHGFNSLFAVASIEAAKTYYAEFARQQKNLSEAQRLKVGIIYSYGANEEVLEGGIIPDEDFDAHRLDQSSRDFLDAAIDDYNGMFGTNFDTSSEGFANYYTNLSERLKNRELDIVVVVNMFLTGFDATTLSTLWVDKNLRQHGLIQAFSRTNRILNRVKAFGNIVCFRDLEEQTNEAIALFGNKEAGGIVLLRPYYEYYNNYTERVDTLLEKFGDVTALPQGEQEQRLFLKLWGEILRLRNILTSFDDFADEDLLNPAQVQDYSSIYLHVRDALIGGTDPRESIVEDLVFELELIKQVEVNIDFILMMVKKYCEGLGLGSKNKEILADVERALNASVTLRSKRDLIEAFIASVNAHSAVDDEWQRFIAERKSTELESIIKSEQLEASGTRELLDRAFRDGKLKTNGSAISNILPPVSRFTPDSARDTLKMRVTERLVEFFERFFGLG